MLPTSVSGNGVVWRSQRSNHGALATYLRRLARPSQMDFGYAFWLMLQLCIAPKTAYRHTSYHKQTKNQWARDDPAFVVVLCGLVAAATTAYCVTFAHGLLHALLSVLSAVLVDCLLLGAAVATACWLVANRFLRRRNLPQHQVEQHLEWLYAFDVHCNAFFPLFLLLYVLQFVVSPVLLWRGIVPAAVSCALYAVAFGVYSYLTFLGYSALPFLERTEVFLWPVGLVGVALPFALLARFNPTRFVLGIYFRA